MKTITSIVIGILCLTLNLQAQKSFQKGNILLSPSVGLGTNYSNFGTAGLTPSIFFSADFGVHDYVSVGPYVGASFFNFATGVDVGARGNFHWWQLLDDKVSKDLKQSQIDIYLTLWLGYEMFIFDKNIGNNGVNSFDAGFTQGIRWYPNANKRIAVFGEFGYTPISFATVGATFKIGSNQ